MLCFSSSLRCSALGLLLALSAGCSVQQSKYDELLQANRALKEQNTTLADEKERAEADLQTVRQQLSLANAQLDELMKKYNLTQGDLELLSGKYDDMMKNVANLAVGPLPDDVATALRELAAAYPDVLTFDERRGMLRFASDFTFDLGSDALSSSAQSTLTKLASILNSASASSFEVDVVGHTDNVPISNAGTRAKHPTNVHLSVHRSITVRDALVRAGVAANRFQVAGFGEFRPVVANPSRGGARENRRVEIFLRPMSGGAMAASEAPKAASVQDAQEPMK